MKIKAIIVDDEPHAVEIIETYLKSFQDVDLVAKCGNGIDAFRVLQQNKVDLAFLDVKMPGLNGTDLVKTLKNPPRVIFTTAYQDYAVEGFELNAIDYLVKPIPFDRFLKAMDKVYYFFGLTNQAATVVSRTPVKDSPDYIYLKVDRKMVKVDVAEILWIESYGDYVKVALPEKVLVSKQKISILEELLPDDAFLRIHRSFMVNIAKIDSYNAMVVEIAGKDIPIGRNYKNDSVRKLRG
jgi:DNA-binding LytR/AlgR family response regulator